jgi:PASTA domain
MSEDLEDRLRDVLAASPRGHASRESRARTAALNAIPRGRGRARQALSFAIPATGFAALAALLVLALPKGTEDAPSAANGPVPFAILNQGTPPNLAALGIRRNALGFPRIDPTSLRAIALNPPRALPILAGRTTDGLVCLVQSFRLKGGVPYSACGLPDDISRSAIVGQPVRDGRRVVLVADGVRITSTDPEAVRRLGTNVFQVARGVEKVTAIYPDDARRTLRVNDLDPSSLLSDADAARPGEVPDVVGLGTGAAVNVLYAWRMADGRRTTQETDSAAPGTVIGQDPAPGATADGNTEVRLVVATPTGPNGQREVVNLDTRFQWEVVFRPTGQKRRPGGRLREFAGRPTILAFTDSPRQAAGLQWFAVQHQTVVVLNRSRDALRTPGEGYSSVGALNDPNGEIARVLGVTMRPTTVVLDSAGRIVSRQAGVPTYRSKKLLRTLQALQLEPRSSFLPIPDAPENVWFLSGRDPLPVDEVPVFLDVPYFDEPVIRERVWSYGPTADGWRAYVGITSTSPFLKVSALSVRGEPRGTRPRSGGGFGGGPLPPRQLREAATWTVSASTFNNHRFTGIYLVKGGYTRGTLNGKTYEVSNGMLSVSASTRDDDTLVLSGPAGTRKVDLGFRRR